MGPWVGAGGRARGTRRVGGVGEESVQAVASAAGCGEFLEAVVEDTVGALEPEDAVALDEVVGEVAAGAGADQGGVGGVEAAAASMERVDRGEDHGSGLRCWSFDQSRAASERAAEALHISFGEC